MQVEWMQVEGCKWRLQVEVWGCKQRRQVGKWRVQ